MCEWLERGEWCDVQLLCGGRTFNAHRAVLATVSPFLRKLLLSCPDESKTFIVLPDTDLDAMSSVLYYIYNGEVSIQMHKQEKFLDLMKTLQIFIELQYLPGYSEKNYEKYNHETKFEDIDVFTLDNESDCQNKKYVHLRKGQSIQEALLLFNKCIENPQYERNHASDSHKMQLLEGRQKSFNQRDIEKYPQNGYCNGVTEHVMEISNRFYLEPSSKPLMNANDVLRGDTTLSATFRMPDQAHFNMKLSQNVYKTYESKSNTNLFADYHNGTRNAHNLWKTHMPLLPLALLPQLNDNNILQKPTVSSLDLSGQSISLHKTPYSSSLITTQDLAQNCFNTKKNKLKQEKSKNMDRRNTIICNEVLQNPWSPRQPNNYRAFKRKAESDITQNDWKITMGNNYNLSSSSDSNNNVNNLNTRLANEDNKCKGDSPEMSPLLFNQDQAPPNDSVLKKEPTGRYNCEECTKTFSQLRNYKYHMSIHRGTKEFAATCSICGKYFNDRGYLSSHMKIHRNRKEYKCPQCPKSFNQRVAYNMHVRIHTGIKPHVCDECGKAFSRKMLLKQHYRTHSGERPYACPHCDKRFADRSNMTLHLRLHTGVKPFSCTMCPKSFTKKHHLKSHLNFHTGAKPYSCPRCNLAFTQSSNMRTHLKKCTTPGDSS